MRRLLAICILTVFSNVAASGGVRAQSAETETVRSLHSVGQTLDRLEAALKAKGVTVFARIDHAAGAKQAGLDLKPTQLLIFGNPKLGTPLMQAEPTVGLELPMKVLAWENARGETWVSYTKPAALQARYGVRERDKVFETMASALGSFVKAATQSASE